MSGQETPPRRLPTWNAAQKQMMPEFAARYSLVEEAKSIPPM
jgi:hypothetical protein